MWGGGARSFPTPRSPLHDALPYIPSLPPPGGEESTLLSPLLDDIPNTEPQPGALKELLYSYDRAYSGKDESQIFVRRARWAQVGEENKQFCILKSDIGIEGVGKVEGGERV